MIRGKGYKTEEVHRFFSELKNSSMYYLIDKYLQDISEEDYKELEENIKRINDKTRAIK